MERDSKRSSLSQRRKAALILLRTLLIESGLFSVDKSKDIEIRRQASGKPYLVSLSNQASELPFISISHSGPWIACLLSTSIEEACIDIEDLKPSRPIEKLSAYAFSKDEHSFVLEKGKIGFYKLWTAKEAIAKCREQGLRAALKIDFSSELSAFNAEGNKVVQCDEVSYSLLQDILSGDVLYTVAHKNTAKPSLLRIS